MMWSAEELHLVEMRVFEEGTSGREIWFEERESTPLSVTHVCCISKTNFLRIL